ncbi:uncharacterized protein BT62DRAFT_1076562 [Guyanagaster necrorhizus]|uniref:Uncharacterized protein n=1 Tax=Guyanagaster necrorhizus TaxID=856835 RepID=A0A9P8ATS9_9AGAR|nr:uncharacterized protein BT62DRAFT_1076562 [Guyanagaster necrorhizus MCA 3950]KAG7446182.1 hypothetical protein BT62DRAFT_1076562 [Guyanagaster necrorhizus MCA 3950]
MPLPLRGLPTHTFDMNEKGRLQKRLQATHQPPTFVTRAEEDCRALKRAITRDTITKPTHILKQGPGKPCSEKSSAEHATWDILCYFAALSEEEVAGLDANVDCSLRPDASLSSLVTRTYVPNAHWMLACPSRPVPF